MTREEARMKLCTTPIMVLEGNVTQYEEALKLAIEALEKQIPFKPVVDRKWSRCKCGKLALSYNFCPNCGQKLLKAGVKND